MESAGQPGPTLRLPSSRDTRNGAGPLARLVGPRPPGRTFQDTPPRDRPHVEPRWVGRAPVVIFRPAPEPEAPLDEAETIRTALERNVKAVSLRPGVGQGTARSTATLGPGLSCRISEGPWTLTVGMPESMGGSGAGPTPGVLGRGALASCIALGYAMWAARLGVPIEALSVEVEAEYDARGELGVSPDVRPGYLSVRYTVTVRSPAPESEIMRVLDTGDRYSSYRDIFGEATPLRREVRLDGGRHR